LLGKFSLPPGRYQLRIAANSPRPQRWRGSVFADLDVSDFLARPASTVAPASLLSTSPAPPAAPGQCFRRHFDLSFRPSASLVHWKPIAFRSWRDSS
jgi:hypothetical protein